MRLLILSGFLLFLVQIANSQTYYSFPKDSATWYYQVNDIDDWGFEHCYSTSIYSLVGDTTINNINYTKVYYNMYGQNLKDTAYNSLTAQYFGGLREDSTRKIWAIFSNDSIEYLMYDFSLSLGDTFDLPFYGYPDSFFVVGQDSLLFNDGKYRVQLGVTGGYGYNQWVQGIGGLYGDLFEPCSPFNTVGIGSTFLTCFKVGNQYVYGGQNCYCGNITNVNEVETIGSKIEIYPNPVGSTFKVDSKEEIFKQNCTITIVDLLGKFIYSKPFVDYIIEISTENIPKGVYLIKINDQQNNLLAVKKLVIE